jgi:predicted dehydrogenase
MKNDFSRREFLRRSSILAGGLAVAGKTGRMFAATSTPDKVSIGVVGCNGRGMAHIAALASLPNAEISYICDVDQRAVKHGQAFVVKAGRTEPRGVTDLRRILDDPKVDAISIATPDHWHTPAAMLACAAGKHVYVEKPGSHNGQESEWLVAAARKHKRVVQMGNQRRSWPWVQEAIARLHAGELGQAFFARGWYTNHRPSIGHGKVVPVPEWLDYSLWQGPAPERPFRDNILHYNWHWFWNWGTGELGNNGVHSLDLARWGLQVELPERVTCGGRRYHFQDDWETPDIYVTEFDFGGKGIAWEGQSCDPRGFEGSSFGVNFYAEKGTLAITDKAVFYDLNNKVIREIAPGKMSSSVARDAVHFDNFLDGIRNGAPLRAEIEEGQKSTLLCHLGNIAWRTGRTVNFNPAGKKIVGDRGASKLWNREYRKGWKPVV